MKIRDTVGAIPAEDIDEVMPNVVGDIRNFMEDGIQKVKEQMWEEFQFMAKRWMEQNPRKSPEEEKVEADKATDDIMDQIPEERQTMSLEEKILAKLMGEELLLEVDYEQAQASLTASLHRNSSRVLTSTKAKIQWTTCPNSLRELEIMS